MAVFGYRVTDGSGKVTEGVIEAAGERAATDRLREMDLVPIRVWPASAGAERKGEAAPRERPPRRPPVHEEIVREIDRDEDRDDEPPEPQQPVEPLRDLRRADLLRSRCDRLLHVPATPAPPPAEVYAIGA